LSWNLANRRASAGLTGGVTGMSDTVKLGGGGGIKTSPRIVLRARLEPDPGTEQLNAYWVGRHFTDFDGTEWTTATAASPASAQVTLVPPGRGRTLVRQDIELTPAYASRTLVALETPTGFGNARALTPNGSSPMALIEVVGDQVSASVSAPAATYSATSATDGPR
jgi:protein-glutamine gamma-glutamyltransferase